MANAAADVLEKEDDKRYITRCSRNVSLGPADVSPFEQLQQRFGGSNGAVSELWRLLREAKDHARCDGEAAGALVESLQALRAVAADIISVSALGDPFTAMCVESGAVSAALALVKWATSIDRGNPAAPYAEQLLTDLSHLFANCSGDCARHCADVVLRVAFGGAKHTPPRQCCGACWSVPYLEVRLGFSDFATSETGARLWAGAVALSLYLLENLHEVLLSVAIAATALVRVVEIGCGPALVSALLGAQLAAHGGSIAARGADAAPQAPLGRTDVDLYVTDCVPAVIEEARRTIEEKNRLPARFTAGGCGGIGDVAIRYGLIDFCDVARNPADVGQYDLVLGSDVVYDVRLAQFVAPAIAALLRPGGRALLCCERHRDGMSEFASRIAADPALALRVVHEVDDVGECLRHLEMIPGLTASSCALLVLERRA